MGIGGQEQVDTSKEQLQRLKQEDDTLKVGLGGARSQGGWALEAKETRPWFLAGPGFWQALVPGRPWFLAGPGSWQALVPGSPWFLASPGSWLAHLRWALEARGEGGQQQTDTPQDGGGGPGTRVGQLWGQGPTDTIKEQLQQLKENE